VTRDQELTLRDIRALMSKKGNNIVREHMSGNLLLIDVDGPKGQRGQIVVNKDGEIIGRRQRNAGPRSKRKSKKTGLGGVGGFFDDPRFSAHIREGVAGFKAKSEATKAARRERKLRGHNPTQLLFRTRAAALKYAREHGAKRFSIKKLKRGR
jgi:hypothetical protein